MRVSGSIKMIWFKTIKLEFAVVLNQDGVIIDGHNIISDHIGSHIDDLVKYFKKKKQYKKHREI